MTGPDMGSPGLRGERCTDPLDTSDATDAYADCEETTGDPVAAAVLVAGLLIAEAIRESRSS